MTRMIKNITRSQQGFTLIELVVVIAILGVLAAVATPLMVNFLAGAKEEAYNADVEIIQLAVDAFFTDPSNTRFLGKNQYPILGRGETSQTGHLVRCKINATECNAPQGSFAHPDDGMPLLASHKDGNNPAENPDWNPLGGIQGADLLKAAAIPPATGQIIAWTDDGDGVREIIVAADNNIPKSPDKWTTIEVTREGTIYYVDPRYYFIDIAALVTGGFLKETPKSSSKDNSPLAHTNALNTATGSYTYYLDNLGRVQTLPFAFPRTKGFSEGVYP